MARVPAPAACRHGHRTHGDSAVPARRGPPGSAPAHGSDQPATAYCIAPWSRRRTRAAATRKHSPTLVRAVRTACWPQPTATTPSLTTSSPPLAKRAAGAWSRRRTRACGHLPV